MRIFNTVALQAHIHINSTSGFRHFGSCWTYLSSKIAGHSTEDMFVENVTKRDFACGVHTVRNKLIIAGMKI